MNQDTGPGWTLAPTQMEPCHKCGAPIDVLGWDGNWRMVEFLEGGDLCEEPEHMVCPEPITMTYEEALEWVDEHPEFLERVTILSFERTDDNPKWEYASDGLKTLLRKLNRVRCATTLELLMKEL